MSISILLAGVALTKFKGIQQNSHPKHGESFLFSVARLGVLWRQEIVRLLSDNSAVIVRCEREK